MVYNTEDYFDQITR